MSIIGAVIVGQGADTSTCTAGKIAGAVVGHDAKSANWAEAVQQGNPEPNMKDVAQQLTDVIAENLEKKEKLAADLRRLF